MKRFACFSDLHGTRPKRPAGVLDGWLVAGDIYDLSESGNQPNYQRALSHAGMHQWSDGVKEPVYLVHGNHDCADDYQLFMNTFDEPQSHLLRWVRLALYNTSSSLTTGYSVPNTRRSNRLSCSGKNPKSGLYRLFRTRFSDFGLASTNIIDDKTKGTFGFKVRRLGAKVIRVSGSDSLSVLSLGLNGNPYAGKKEMQHAF